MLRRLLSAVVAELVRGPCGAVLGALVVWQLVEWIVQMRSAAVAVAEEGGLLASVVLALPRTAARRIRDVKL